MKRRNFLKGLIASLFVPGVQLEEAIAAVAPRKSKAIAGQITSVTLDGHKFDVVGSHKLGGYGNE